MPPSSSSEPGCSMAKANQSRARVQKRASGSSDLLRKQGNSNKMSCDFCLGLIFHCEMWSEVVACWDLASS